MHMPLSRVLLPLSFTLPFSRLGAVHLMTLISFGESPSELSCFRNDDSHHVSLHPLTSYWSTVCLFPTSVRKDLQPQERCAQPISPCYWSFRFLGLLKSQAHFDRIYQHSSGIVYVLFFAHVPRSNGISIGPYT